jgi:hypothetical protein
VFEGGTVGVIDLDGTIDATGGLDGVDFEDVGTVDCDTRTAGVRTRVDEDFTIEEDEARAWEGVIDVEETVDREETEEDDEAKKWSGRGRRN